MCHNTSGRNPGYRYSSTGAIAKMLSRDSGRKPAFTSPSRSIIKMLSTIHGRKPANYYFPVTQTRTINKNSPANTSKDSAARAAAAKKARAAAKCIHVGVTCDHCFEQNIAGVRHRCSKCVDFDMCDACFAKDQHAHTHPVSSFMHFSSPVVHTDVRCRGCQSQPLTGTRYECTSCKPSLNMCHTCWSTPAKHASQPRHTARHSFVRFAVQGGLGVACDAHDAEFTAAVDKLKRLARK